jgi:hypothetical protein
MNQKSLDLLLKMDITQITEKMTLIMKIFDRDLDPLAQWMTDRDNVGGF